MSEWCKAGLSWCRVGARMDAVTSCYTLYGYVAFWKAYYLSWSKVPVHSSRFAWVRKQLFHLQSRTTLSFICQSYRHFCNHFNGLLSYFSWGIHSNFRFKMVWNCTDRQQPAVLPDGVAYFRTYRRRRHTHWYLFGWTIALLRNAQCNASTTPSSGLSWTFFNLSGMRMHLIIHR